MMPKKILVIDDEGIITKTIDNLLKREGYITEVAKNGFEAIEKVKNIDFNLIIADLRMPNMDGLETVKHIKKYIKEKAKADIPTIFITGYADSDIHIKAKEFGDVIFKPFDIRDFLTTVNRNVN